MAKTKKRKRKSVGRPTVMTPDVLDKLRQAYLWGATDEEASDYAGIARKTLSNYKAQNPDFLHKTEAWKNDPILRAKKRITDDIDTDPNTAKWYLERKKKDEFSTRKELTGNEGKPISVLLEELETDYDEFAGQVEKQAVADEQPVQDKGQKGKTNKVQDEPDTGEAHDRKEEPQTQPASEG